MTEHGVKDGERYNTFKEWADAVIRSLCCFRCRHRLERNTRNTK